MNLYDCELCGQPWPYVCERCQQAFFTEEENVIIEEPKKYIGSGEDVDLSLCVS